jgi:hypothetical protein
MPQEPRLFRGGEVTFRPGSDKSIPPEVYQRYDGAYRPRRSQDEPWLGWLILIAIILLAVWVAK